MPSIADLADALQSLFTTGADEAAAESGFVLRKRLWTGPAFAQALVLGWLDRPDAPLERLAAHAGSSRQALEQRLTPRAVDFLGRLLARALELPLAASPAAVPLLRRFRGVYVEDCTSIPLPRSCADALPGCGGPAPDAGRAALKVYVRYEITGGSVAEVDFQPGRQPDVTAGQAHAALPAGSLRLADLGFFDLGVLASYAAQGVHWVSRLPCSVAVAAGGRAPAAVAEFLAAQGGDCVDEGVTLGAGGALRCRLIAWRCPPGVARRRRERLAASARKKGRAVSARQWEMAGWAVLATDLPAGRLCAKEAWELYRARWLVELLFKRRKGQGGLARPAGRAKGRVLCEVLAKLLGQVVANWAVLLRGGPAAGPSAAKAQRVVQEAAGLLRRALGTPALLLAVLERLADDLGRIRPTRRRRPATRERLLAPLLAG